MLWIYGVPLEGRTGHEAAYGLLAHAYNEIYGGRLPRMRRGAWGKPFFPHNEAEFSLTHTKTMAFCALSDRPVGVDAETVRPVRPGVPERTMSPEELTWMNGYPDRDEAFLRLWTAKEAWSKLTGRGLNGRPREIVLTAGPGDSLGVAGERAQFQWRRTCGVLVTACAAEISRIQWVILPELPAGPVPEGTA